MNRPILVLCALACAPFLIVGAVLIHLTVLWVDTQYQPSQQAWCGLPAQAVCFRNDIARAELSWGEYPPVSGAYSIPPAISMSPTSTTYHP